MKSAILFFSALSIIIFGGVILFKQPAATAQVTPTRPDSTVESQFDAQLSRVEDKTLKVEQIKPEQKLKPIYRVRRVPVIKEVLAEDQKVLLNIQGEKYEVRPILYRGYILIDVDSVQQAIVDQEVEEAIAADTMSQAAIEHADEQITLWKKFKSIFKHKN